MKMEVSGRMTLLATSALSLLFIFGSLQTAAAAGQQGLGEKCTYDTDCQEAHAYCDDSGTGCDCKAGYTKSANKMKCLSVEGIFELGAKCEEDVQCAFTDKASTCKGGQCRGCDDNTVQCDDPTGCTLHDIDGKCWKSKKLGESCTSDEQCWITSAATASRKCAAKCICAVETENDKCMQGTRSENTNSAGAVADQTNEWLSDNVCVRAWIRVRSFYFFLITPNYMASV